MSKTYLVQVDKNRSGKHLVMRPELRDTFEWQLKRYVASLPVGAKLTVTIETDDPNVETSA
jgi:hypothetical protein